MRNLMSKGYLIGCWFVNLDNNIDDNFDYYIENKDDPKNGDDNIMHDMTVQDEDWDDYGDIT